MWVISGFDQSFVPYISGEYRSSVVLFGVFTKRRVPPTEITTEGKSMKSMFSPFLLLNSLHIIV